LEDEIGTSLLNRKTRPAKLTEAGDILQSAVFEGLGRIAEAIQRIADLEHANDGTVTLACSVGVATYWLMPRLALFYEAEPGISVNVMTTSDGAPPLASGVDMAIRFGNGRWTDGDVIKLFDDHVMPVCSPDFLARHGGGPLDLTRVPLLHVDVPDETWVTWPLAMAQFGLPYEKSDTARKAGRRFTNYVQATQAAVAGQGVMLGWDSIAGLRIAEGRLVVANDSQFTPENAFYVVVSPRRSSSAIDTLCEWLPTARDAL
jgi:DNA-binding transcriptional LysR family regulator